MGYGLKSVFLWVMGYLQNGLFAKWVKIPILQECYHAELSRFALADANISPTLIGLFLIGPQPWQIIPVW